jgi:hypothetical protein
MAKLVKLSHAIWPSEPQKDVEISINPEQVVSVEKDDYYQQYGVVRVVVSGGLYGNHYGIRGDYNEIVAKLDSAT